MARLHDDQTFHFELLRALGTTRYGGADVGEVLAIGGRLKTGDWEGWHDQFYALAQRVEQSVAEAHPVSRRDGLFRAATYYRCADFFLHGKPEDPRIDSLWQKQRECFDAALPLLPWQAERVTVRADGFDVPAIFYRASEEPGPTVLICSGFDGSQEELWHHYGMPVLERGWNVLTFEGPGQPTVRREQQLGFIHDWERVVTPVVDYALTRMEVSKSQVALVGTSMGGYLAARAAAFEHRLAATILIDGVADMFPTFGASLPKGLLALLDDETNRERFDALISERPPPTDAKTRWAVEQGLWSFNTRSAFELFSRVRKMTLAGLEGKFRHPVLVCDGARDHFFSDQPAQAAQIIGSPATHYVFADDELAAGEHCHVGASVEMSRVVYDWLADVLRGRPA